MVAVIQATHPRQDLQWFDPTRDKTYRQARSARAVTDWLAWLELGGTAPRTLDTYERDLSRLCLRFPQKDLAEVTDGDLLHVIRSFPPASRRVRKAAYQSFFKWAIKTRRIEKNPMDFLPDIKATPQRFIDTFNEAESERLCGLPLRDGTLMALLIDAGLRKGDCKQFRVRSFKPESVLDAPHGKLVLLRGKGGRDRVVPATERVSRMVAELTLLDGLNADEYLWYTVKANAVSRTVRRRNPIIDSSFDRWWRRCVAEAEVPYRNPHVARHTFATNWLRRGGRLTTLSRVMGHSSIKTTFDLYGHLDLSDIALDLALIESVSKASVHAV